MFDIGWQELFIVAVLGIIVIGPKDLPSAMRTIAGLVRKLRGMAREFQSGLDDMMRQAELDDIKSEMDATMGSDLGRSIEDAIDPTGEIADDLKMGEIESDLDDSLRQAPDAGPTAPGADVMPSPPDDQSSADAADADDQSSAGAAIAPATDAEPLDPLPSKANG